MDLIKTYFRRWSSERTGGSNFDPHDFNERTQSYSRSVVQAQSTLERRNYLSTYEENIYSGLPTYRVQRVFATNFGLGRCGQVRLETFFGRIL